MGLTTGSAMVAVIPAYTLLSVCYESAFLFGLSATLHLWVHSEDSQSNNCSVSAKRDLRVCVVFLILLNLRYASSLESKPL